MYQQQPNLNNTIDMTKFLQPARYLTQLFVTCMLSFACSSPSSNSSEVIDTITNTATRTENLGSTITTAYTGNKFVLPDGFILDSIKRLDSSSNTEIKLTIPIYTANQQLNTNFKELINQKLNKFLIGLTPADPADGNMQQAIPNNFNIEPAYVYKNEQIISYCLIITSNRGDAVHPSAEYYCFNYDINKNKSINFADYFTIGTKQDTLSLIDLINKGMPSGELGIETLNSLDFNLEPDSIAFNFDQGEISSTANGLIKAKVAKQYLQRFLTQKQ